MEKKIITLYAGKILKQFEDKKMYVYVLLYWYEMFIGALVGKQLINSPHILEGQKGKLRIYKRSMIAFLLVLVPLVVIMGGRNNIGIDTITYRYIFNRIANDGVKDLSNIEIGYKLVNVFISKFTSNSQWLFVICAIVICGNFCRFFKNVEAPLCVMLAIFLGYGYFFYAMNIMRQYLAISIVLANVHEIEKGENKKFIISVLVATLFHVSSLIWLVLFFVRKWDDKKFFLATFAILLCARLGISGLIYLLRYTAYGHFFFSESRFVLQRMSYTNIFFSAVILIIYLSMRNRIFSVNDIRIKCVWMAFLAYLLLNPLGDSIIRMFLGFQIYGTAIIGECISKLHPKIRGIAMLSIVFLGFLGMCTVLNLQANQSQHFIPSEWGKFI